MGPGISVSEEGDINFLREAIRGLEHSKIYVGIPEDETIRPDEEITNAALMYIHTNGSLIRNIPPRPVIEPAIEAEGNRQNIEAGLNAVVNARLDGNVEQAKSAMEAVGTIGSNAAKRWFTDPRNGWKANSEMTIARKGSDRPLIDTGELRRSITHIEEID
jgi:hypothetical protein